MLYNLLYPLAEDYTIFNLFKYLTVRSGGALFTAFFLSLYFGPRLIDAFKRAQSTTKTVRDAHPSSSVSSKQGTPTMGGVLVILTLFSSTIIWADLTSSYIWVLLSVTTAFGFIGLLDDYLSITKKWNNGLPGRVRLAVQATVCVAIIYLITKINVGENATYIYFPFFKDTILSVGLIGFLLFGTLVIVGSANAVNLTDGLDGLVSIPAVMVAASLGVLAYITGRVDFTEYLHLPHIAGTGEITVFCGALVGALLGFLWFNAPPARIFMGDTGALAVGAALGTISVIIKHEFVLAIIGGLFVLETVSVMVQVASFKLTGKRVFRMAPLHHHYEQLGWPESTIVVRFWIISILFALIGLATLKLR